MVRKVTIYGTRTAAEKVGHRTRSVVPGKTTVERTVDATVKSTVVPGKSTVESTVESAVESTVLGYSCVDG